MNSPQEGVPPESGAGGTYVLVLRASRRTTAAVGALGRTVFPRGYYLYVGSALGPGGIAARVRRHLAGTGRRHWHIDHLRAVTLAVEVWWAVGDRREHDWAGALARELTPAALRFGTSDCRCATHLFYSERRPTPLLMPDPVTIYRG